MKKSIVLLVSVAFTSLAFGSTSRMFNFENGITNNLTTNVSRDGDECSKWFNQGFVRFDRGVSEYKTAVNYINDISQDDEVAQICSKLQKGIIYFGNAMMFFQDSASAFDIAIIHCDSENDAGAIKNRGIAKEAAAQAYAAKIDYEPIHAKHCR